MTARQPTDSVPAEDPDDLRSHLPGIPTFEDARRLWRDAGARREEESPGTVLDYALEGIGINDASREALAWIRGARAAAMEGGLNAETAHCVIWAIAARAARCREDDMPQLEATFDVLRAAGETDLLRAAKRDLATVEFQMHDIRRRLGDEARAVREWRRRSWAPPGQDRPDALHEVFRVALAAARGGSAEHDAVRAGLLTLELYDTGFFLGRSSAAPDAPAMTRARQAIARLPQASPLQRALARVVNRIQRAPVDGNEGLQDDLLAMAEAYAGQGLTLLAADVCYVIVRGWEYVGCSAEPRARRMLRQIERDLAQGE